MSINPIKIKLVMVLNWVTKRLVSYGFLKKPSNKLLRLGTAYGGWYIPESLLNFKGRKSLISCGVGFDVSFDKELAQSDFNVVLIDPLKNCIEFAQRELSNFSKCCFENIALSNFIGKELFFPPKNKQHDSWSSTNMQEASFIEAEIFEVVNLNYIFSKYQTIFGDGRLYIKMDIEGAEIKIFRELCQLAHNIDFVGIEMDFLALIPFFDFKKRVRSIILGRKFLRDMSTSNFNLVHTENFNFFWEGHRSDNES